MALMHLTWLLSGFNNPSLLNGSRIRNKSRTHNPPLTKTRPNMPTSHRTPCPSEYKAYDFFPTSPGMSPEPDNDDLQQQLNQATVEVAAVKQQLNALKAQMQVSIEESVLVSEAHLQVRMEENVQLLEEKLKIQLDNDVGVRVMMEMAVVSVFVLLVSVAGALIGRAFGV